MNRKQRRAEQKQGRSVAAVVPGYVQDIFTTALRFHQAGQLAEAEQRYRQVLELAPRHADSLHLLGVIAGQTGRYDASVQLIGKAITIDANEAEYHSNLGNAFNAQGKLIEAVACFRRALDLNPAHPRAYNNLGIALKELGRLDDAILCYGKAIDLIPNFFEAYNNLGIALNEQGRLAEAVAAYRKAIDFKPDYPEAHNNLANSLRDQGCLEEALIHYQRALFFKPDYTGAHSNHLMLLHYSLRYTDADILVAAREFARGVERSRSQTAFRNQPDPQRRLRIGYVSGDFRVHSVGYFLARVLEAHDPSSVEVTCYSNSGVADAMTARLKGAVGRWRSIVGLTDEDAAAMILADGIDILVDLSGHTANNRLPLFALKPAPVQVTWLGYSGTTGLSTIDYILADNVVAPKGGEAAFSETVWRLPGCYLCYSPPALDIAVGPFPALTNGFVTFGCFNSRTKISAETLAVWAAILRRVEGSRLFLKSKSFADESCRKALEAAFAEHGIESDRLTLMAYLPQGEALDAYNKVDIALDPFPYGGTTTTAEMLWMGVPLVALGEGRWVTRVSRSILATLGLDAWVAKDADDYIEIACRLAADLHNLAPLRADLRGRVESSALCDGPRFTRSLEEAYRGMWIKWCAGRGGEER